MCKRYSLPGVPLLLLILTTGCAQEMMNQPRVESQEMTDAYSSGHASRSLPPSTVPASARAMQSVSRGGWSLEEEDDIGIHGDPAGYLSGKVDGELVSNVPDKVLMRLDYAQLLQRGRQEFNVFCVPCHDQTGSGNGMVARRGFKFPPSYHIDRLRQKPIGYLFRVATHGHGEMPAYGDSLSNDDRWAIAAYVRALQFSQHALMEQLPDVDREKLDEIGIPPGKDGD